MNNVDNAYRLCERIPTDEEYRAICEAVGWTELDFAAAQRSLPRSIYAVVVEHAGHAVGMGRLVGDGAMYYYLQDVAVRPEHQGRGLGRQIVEQLMQHVQEQSAGLAFVGLFAAQGTESFYQHYGFAARPSLTGMFQVIQGRR